MSYVSFKESVLDSSCRVQFRKEIVFFLKKSVGVGVDTAVEERGGREKALCRILY